MKRLLLLLLFLALAAQASLAQTYTLSPVAKNQFFDNSGAAAANFNLCTYAAGTTTKVATYSDNVGTPNANPILLDSAGRATIYLIAGTSYKYGLQDAASTTCNSGNVLWTQDNIPANLAGTIALSGGGTGASLTASNGGIVYSGASALAILAGTPTANQVLLSGASGTPSWSSAAYPSSAGTNGNCLVSNGTNFTSTTCTSAATSFANPTASVGLTAVNGASNSAMRSDAAPALDQTISPTMTGAWRFNTNGIGINATAPGQAGQINAGMTLLGTTFTAGYVGKNTSAAQNGAQQVSPGIQLEGQGWETNTSASQLVDFRSYIIPVQGGANPTGRLVTESSVNGAGYGGQLNQFTSGGLSLGTTTDPGAGVINANTGFQIANAATSNHALVGNGTSYVDAAIVNSLTGTANRVTVSASTGAITLSGPQDLATTSTPQFVTVLASSDSSTTAPMLQVTNTNASGRNWKLGDGLSATVSGAGKFQFLDATSNATVWYSSTGGNFFLPNVAAEGGTQDAWCRASGGQFLFNVGAVTCTFSDPRSKHAIIPTEWGVGLKLDVLDTADISTSNKTLTDLASSVSSFSPNTGNWASSASDFIERVPVHNFFFNNASNDVNHRIQHFGFLSTEVAALEPRLARYDETGYPKTVEYVEVIPILVEDQKVQHARITDLENRLAAAGIK